MTPYNVFFNLSDWVQPMSVITKSVSAGQWQVSSGEKRLCKIQPWCFLRCHTQELCWAVSVYKNQILCLPVWIQSSTCWSDEVKPLLHQQCGCGISEACGLIWDQLIINCSTEAKAPCWPVIIRFLPSGQRNIAHPGSAGRMSSC